MRKYFHISADNEPNIAVALIFFRKDGKEVFSQEQAKGAIKSALEDHFNTKVVIHNDIIFAAYEHQTTVRVTVDTGTGETGKGWDYTVSLNEIHIYAT